MNPFKVGIAEKVLIAAFVVGGVAWLTLIIVAVIRTCQS